MSINSIAGFFLGRDKTETKTQPTNYQEPGLQSIPLNNPIATAVNPDRLRVVRNRLAAIKAKREAS